MRFVISKVHQAEGTFLKKKDFVSMSLSGSAPRDYAIVQWRYQGVLAKTKGTATATPQSKNIIG